MTTTELVPTFSASLAHALGGGPRYMRSLTSSLGLCCQPMQGESPPFIWMTARWILTWGPQPLKLSG